MKNIAKLTYLNVLTGSVLLLFLVSGCQDKAGADLIYEASSSGVVVGAYSGFKSAFPNAQSVSWNRLQDQLWEARFTESSVEKAALVRYTGQIVDHGLLADPAGLPTSLLAFVQAQYPGYTLYTVLTGAHESISNPVRIYMVNAQTSQVSQVLVDAGGQPVAVSSL